MPVSRPVFLSEVACKDTIFLVVEFSKRFVAGVEFDLVQVGEDVGVSITIFQTQEQAEEANRRAADWVKQNVAPLVAGPPETVAVGEVRLRKG